jgi:hypothetical protein
LYVFYSKEAIMFKYRKVLLFVNRAVYLMSAAMLIAGLVLTVVPAQPAAATVETCVCHQPPAQNSVVCASNSGVINGHLGHGDYIVTTQAEKDYCLAGNDIPPVYGCTDSTATNYNPSATLDDGSCTYPPDLCPNIAGRQNPVPSGLMIDASGNCVVPCVFNTQIPSTDPACVAPVTGCTNPLAINYNPAATVDDGSCILPVSGCMNPTALNYNPAATVDDGSCILPIPGCMNPAALNYDPTANVDNGTCILPITGCTNPDALNYNPAANVDDGSCILPVPGCMNPTALNYNADANVDDGSCILPIPGCMNPIALNYNAGANVDDGTCILPVSGCMNQAALNYDPAANVDDGSCIFPVSGCTNPIALNYNPDANSDDGTCILPVPGCMNPIALNYDQAANVDDGSCILPIPGCMNPLALNYNLSANLDDGSCILPVPGCTNPASFNYNEAANVDNGSCVSVCQWNETISSQDPECLPPTNPTCQDPNAINIGGSLPCIYPLLIPATGGAGGPIIPVTGADLTQPLNGWFFGGFGMFGFGMILTGLRKMLNL